MVVDEWTKLVRHVDSLINELRVAREETKKWRAHAIELERFKNTENRAVLLENQSEARELERFRKERKKMITMVTKLIAELDQAQIQVLENKNG
ncbi:hypothetical protein KAR34_12610 [bacterium]|nr:hypothetical protein [bacterium]